MASWADALAREWDREDDRGLQGLCPCCGGVNYTVLGQLGRKVWIRCRDCGIDVGFSRAAE